VTTRDLLAQLISFDTVSRNSNIALMHYVSQWLEGNGIASKLIPNHDGSKANLYATVGPEDSNTPFSGGVMLSGHTDVVPIDGQNWTKPAFSLTEQNNRYYGRGSADMKGFVACAMSAMASAKHLPLQSPMHLALSYDEEIGCVGVHSLIDHLSHLPVKPCLCIVGEPTEMSVATRHKGKIGAQATFTGRAGHSALAPHGLNAIHLACDFITHLRELQIQLAAPFADGDATQVPYSTVHAGIISGGTALNIVPDSCTVAFEVRNAAEDDAQALLDGIITHSTNTLAGHHARIPEASVTFEIFNTYPGLNTPEDTWAVEFVKSLTGANSCTEVAFGTEAGLFSSVLSIPSVICGPGSMAQGHKPDEFISIDQMDQCEIMLEKLVTRLCQSSPGTP
jgi:acetylornithine deacetylase